jgi:hypothetical protein
MMVGTTLVEIREHVEALASTDGAFLVRCGRTGDRPVPISGLRFERRAAARNAARAAEQYRTALRRYDPRLPYHDLIVCQETGSADPRPGSGAVSTSRPQNATNPALSERLPTEERSGPNHRELVEFCHTVAAAVFETLSEEGYDAVGTAVMDAYLELAETIPGPDGLCLCLLESMATELDEQLCPAEQADVLASAATRLPPIDAADPSVSATLSGLEARGLFESYTRSPLSVSLDDGTRSVVVRLSEYALSPQHNRLPVLPIVLELHRHRPDWLPSSLEAVDIGDEWRLTLVQAREIEPSGLVSAPIISEG